MAFEVNEQFRRFWTAGRPVRLVVGRVDPEAGPVVLAHAMHHRRVAERRPEVLEVPGAHLLRARGAVPRVGVGADHAFGGLVGLAEEPPVPPGPREACVGPLELLDQGQPVHDHEVRHRVRVVQCRPVGDGRPAVVAHHGELLVAQPAEQADDRRGHRPFRGLLVFRQVGADLGAPVAREIGTDDRMPFGQQGCHRVPGRVGAWMPVQQDHRAARAAVT